MSSNFILTVELVLVRYKIQDKIGKVPELAGCVQLGRLNLSCLGDTGSIDGSKTRIGETRDSHSPLSKTLRCCPSPHFSHCHSRPGLGWKSGLFNVSRVELFRYQGWECGFMDGGDLVLLRVVTEQYF